MSFIPLSYYSPLYYHFLLVVVFFVFFSTLQKELTDPSNLKSKNTVGIFLVSSIILYMGLRPISFAFGDMGVYNIMFREYTQGKPFDSTKDFLFEGMMYFYAKYLNAELFFFTCSFFYVYLLYAATKKIFADYWFYAFLILVSAFTFWVYGVNGIRNGLATSIFIYGLSRTKKVNIALVLLLACLIHKSMLLPTIAYGLTIFYGNTKTYLWAWFLAIPLSLTAGGFFENFFLGLGFADDKLSTYLGEFNQASEGVQLSLGFRWDFLLFSFSGVYAGWYYGVKKGFSDVLYDKLFQIYLVSNAVWILIIRANYSNRFAFLSWFLLGLVLIYPLLKSQLFKKQHQLIGLIIIGYFAFTYLMIIILNK